MHGKGKALMMKFKGLKRKLVLVSIIIGHQDSSIPNRATFSRLYI